MPKRQGEAYHTWLARLAARNAAMWADYHDLKARGERGIYAILAERYGGPDGLTTQRVWQIIKKHRAGAAA